MISLIVPSLNVRKYISECIESILKQGLSEIEVICVDAGSTDGTLEVLQEYAKSDSRLSIICSTRKSYGYQMNLGLDAARGDYIGIVETDDFIESDMYEKLYALVNEYNLDLVKSNHFMVTGESGQYKKKLVKNLMPQYEYLYGKVLSLNDYSDKFAAGMHTWSGLYRKSFLRENNIRYNETAGASYQDNGFWFQTMMYARRMMVADYAGYNLRRDNPASSIFDSSKAKPIREEYDFIREIINRSDLEMKSLLYKYCFKYRIYNYIWRESRLSDCYFPEAYRYMREDIMLAFERDEIGCKLFTRSELYYLLHAYQSDVPIRKMDYSKVSANGTICSYTCNRIAGCEKLYIFGAGKVGRLMAERLKKIGVYHKIEAFLVSCPVRDEYIGDKRILSLDDVVIDQEDVVIIGVGNALRDEIYNLLKDKNVVNVIESCEIWE